MKYIKLFMFAAFVSLFAACSDDDSNSKEGVTVGFQNAEVTVKENVGYVNVPIVIDGLRNGDVSLKVTTAETGANPAKEDVNYMITTKTLKLKKDTLEANILNVEVKTIDDQEINVDRTFTISIESADGAQIDAAAKTVTVTLRDNDSQIYEKFFGTWTLNALDHNDAVVSKSVTISGTTDETAADYDNILHASSTGLFNIGVLIDCEWRMRYTFDESTRTGTIAFICGDIIATYGSYYEWIWATDDGRYFTTDDVTATWELTDDNQLPSTITFDPNQTLYLYQPGVGYYGLLYNISLTRQ